MRASDTSANYRRGNSREHRRSALIYKFSASVSALIIFLVFTVLYAYGDRNLYEYVLTLYGATPFDFPFLDISGNFLAPWECARKGIDVILSDPCDVLHRGYAYSPLGLAVSGIPLGVNDTTAVGWCLDLVFIGSLSLLPPPQRPVQLLIVLAATFSTMVVFALERANPDILLFIILALACVLAECRLSLRLLGYCLALVAALLKYYPVVALIILFRERKAVFVAVGLIIGSAVFLFWTEYHVEITRALPNIARGPYNTGFFGAVNLPFLLGEGVGNAAASPVVEHLAEAGLYAALVAVCIAICRSLLRFADLRAALASLPDRERVALVIGSAVIVGCFFTGQSIGYRGVFFLLVMPGLLWISRSASRDVRNLGLRASVVIVLLMWGECLRLAIDRGFALAGGSELVIGEVKISFWLIRELGWWWVVSVMLTIVIDFCSDSPIVRWLSSRCGDSVVRVR